MACRNSRASLNYGSHGAIQLKSSAMALRSVRVGILDLLFHLRFVQQCASIENRRKNLGRPICCETTVNQ